MAENNFNIYFLKLQLRKISDFLKTPFSRGVELFSLINENEIIFTTNHMDYKKVKGNHR